MIPLFRSLADGITKGLKSVGDLINTTVGNVRFFLATLFAAILVPINWVLDFISQQLDMIISRIQTISTAIDRLDLTSAQGWWVSGGKAIGQMNAFVPLDYCLTAGSIVLAVWLVVQLLRVIVWAYRLIPFKMA